MNYAVLGPVEARDGDALVPIGGPQQRRLLALMLSRPGQSVSVDRLVECLWPDGFAPEGANRSVMTYVSRLRSALGESAISTVDGGYRLEVDGSTFDSQRFEALLIEAGRSEPGRAVELYDRALAMWRGSAYGEFGAEWFLLGDASRLNENRVVAMEERAEALLAIGNHHRIVAELERLVADQPLRERPVSLLMQALFATGRHAEGLRAFQAFRSRLADETGLDPSSELVSLERALSSGRPAPNVNTRAKLLRGYVVHEVLGEGAFGRVFAATQPGTNREVAIKAIRPEFSDSTEFIQRFEAEAQLVAKLEHPHIVPLYDYWREPGAAYLVFRLLLGGTALGAMINDGPFSVSRVSRLVEEVGSGLLAAHTAGVVHCDIKPSNVLFDETGNAYLSDFGIAVTSSTFDDVGSRTRAYAAPELDGRTGDSVQSDIFSFGCMLWELLAGKSPTTVMSSARRARVPSLAGSISEPCEGLDAVLARATSDDPGSRYESTAELIIAWREAVGRPEGVLTPMGSPAGSQPDSLRRRAVRSLSLEASAAVNPYKGLRAFTEADASDFFGRDDVASVLHDTLMATGFVVVVGPSGSGKSSLVHAGLMPLLRRGGSRVALMVPGERPTAAFRQALRTIVANDSATNDPSELVTEAVADGGSQIVLIVDQFEECWTLADSVERERFLSGLVVAHRHGVRCVATVRADLYDRPLQHPMIGRMVADGTFALPPLSPQALEDAVARPAEQAGVEFDTGVVTAIVTEANAQPAGLPLLQFAMAELYERRVDNRVTSIALQQLGGLAGAIGRRAEEIYRALDAESQAHTRRLFGRLVVPGQGSPDTRRRARLSELSELDRTVADLFVRARLLVADRDVASREPVIEVAHEALLSSWPRLREWLDADRRWLAQLQHLAAANRAWEDSRRADGELYRGSRLEAVIEALPEHEQHLNTDERAFIAASTAARDAIRERERRRARRLRRLLVATAAMLVVALIAGAVALGQRQHARASQRNAEIAALVGQSLSIRTSQRQTAALLAIEAYRLADTPRTRSALFSTFTSAVGNLGSDRSLQALGPRSPGIVLPDGKSALVTSVDQRIRTYDLDTGAVGEPWEPLSTEATPGDSHFVSNASGSLVAQIQWRDNATRTVLAVFDTASHRRVMGPVAVPFGIDSAVFSPDSTKLYGTGGRDGDLVVYSVADGSQVGELKNLPAPPDSISIATTAGLAFVTSGLLAVGSVAGPVRLVDPQTLRVVIQIDSPRGTTEFLSAIDGGRSLIGAGRQGRVRLDIVHPSNPPMWLIGMSDLDLDRCSSFIVAERLGRFYCGQQFGRLEERDIATGALIREINIQGGDPGPVWLASNQNELVIFRNNDAVVDRWRLDGTSLISRRMGDGYSPGGYSPDGRLLLADLGRGQSNPDGTGARVFDTTNWELVAGPPPQFLLDWTADDNFAAFAGPHDHPSIATFDLAGKQLGVSNLVLPRMPDDVWSSRHRFWFFFATTDDPFQSPGEIWTFDRDTGERIQPTISVDMALGASGSDTGDRLAVAQTTGIVLFDGDTGKELHMFSNGPIDSPHSLRRLRLPWILPGNHLLAISPTGQMEVYDLHSFATVTTLSGVRGYGSVSASADGSMLMASGNDRSISLLDVATGTQIGDTIVVPEDEIDSAQFRPDGREIAFGGGVGHQFVVWDLDPQHWVTAACRIAGRNLTEQEWKTNIGNLAPYHKTCSQFA